jgi:hypothetical protein
MKSVDWRKTMHVYWRVQQELNCLGEALKFVDPSLKRSFKQWLKKNASGLAMAEQQDVVFAPWPYLN